MKGQITMSTYGWKDVIRTRTGTMSNVPAFKAKPCHIGTKGNHKCSRIVFTMFHDRFIRMHLSLHDTGIFF